jgi:hypothetical protein
MLLLLEAVNRPADQADRAKRNNNPCGSIHKFAGDF